MLELLRVHSWYLLHDITQLEYYSLDILPIVDWIGVLRAVNGDDEVGLGPLIVSSHSNPSREAGAGICGDQTK